MGSLAIKESQWRDLNSWPLPYQGNALPLSYIGKKKERETGFEPATFSLEGWRSTNWATLAFYTFVLAHQKGKYTFFWNTSTSGGRAGFEPAKVKPTDLQSVLVGRLSISPGHLNWISFEPMEGLEPTTCWLQISCSSQLSYIGKTLI